MVHSRNLVSVRLMRAIGGDYTWNYVTRFGFDKSQLPNDLTLALGTAELSPLQVATAYATFANGGYKVSSYYVDRIEDAAGKILQQAAPAIACYECDHPTDAQVRSGARAGSLETSAHDGKTMIAPKNLAPQILKPQIDHLTHLVAAEKVATAIQPPAVAHPAPPSSSPVAAPQPSQAAPPVRPPVPQAVSRPPVHAAPP